jgi:hypothetical protein
MYLLVFIVIKLFLYVFISITELGINRMSNILDVAKSELDPGDKVLHHYRVIYERKEGQLILTNQKIIFMVRKGIFRPHYEPILDMPYDTITNITPVASHAFELESLGTQYRLTSLGAITANIIVHEISDIKEHHEQN